MVRPHCAAPKRTSAARSRSSSTGLRCSSCAALRSAAASAKRAGGAGVGGRDHQVCCCCGLRVQRFSAAPTSQCMRRSPPSPPSPPSPFHSLWRRASALARCCRPRQHQSTSSTRHPSEALSQASSWNSRTCRVGVGVGWGWGGGGGVRWLVGWVGRSGVLACRCPQNAPPAATTAAAPRAGWRAPPRGRAAGRRRGRPRARRGGPPAAAAPAPATPAAGALTRARSAMLHNHAPCHQPLPSPLTPDGSPPPPPPRRPPPPRPTSATTSSCTSTSTRPPRRDTSASFTNSSECAWALRWACRLSDSSQSCCSNQAGLPTSSMSKARRRSAMRSASAAVRAVACDGAGWRRSGSSGGPRRWSACSAIQTHLVQPSRGGRGLAATSQQGLHRGDVSYAGGHRLQLVVEINCAHVQLVCRIFGGSTQCQCHAHSHW